MKYMIEWTFRSAGLTHDQNFENTEGLLNAFGKWKPESGLIVHAFLSNLGGDGGYSSSRPVTPRSSSRLSRNTLFGTTSEWSQWSTSARRYRYFLTRLVGREKSRKADCLQSAKIVAGGPAHRDRELVGTVVRLAETKTGELMVDRA